MPIVQLKHDSPKASFQGSKYGVKERWFAGESRELDADTAERLIGSLGDMFEIQTTASAKPTVDRAVKSPAKKTTSKAKAKPKAKPKPKKAT